LNTGYDPDSSRPGIHGGAGYLSRKENELALPLLHCLIVAGTLAIPQQSADVVPAFTRTWIESDGKRLSLHATPDREVSGSCRFQVRFGVARPGWNPAPVPVEKRNGRNLKCLLPGSRSFSGLRLRYQWLGYNHGRKFRSPVRDVQVPDDLLVSPLNDFEVDRLFSKTLVVDGNLQPWFHDGKADSRGYTRIRKVPDREVQNELRTLGINALTLTYSYREGEARRSIRRMSDYLDARKHYRRVRTSYDLERARQARQVAVLLYSQKHFPLDGDVKRIDRMYTDGLRIFQIAYGRSDRPNQAADEQIGGGTGDFMEGVDSGRDLGLTKLGRAAVARMVKLHMIIDVSHCNDRTVMETVKAAGVPVLANHANVRSLLPRSADRRRHRQRNMGDSALRAIAESGGVIAVTAIGPFLDTESDGGDLSDFIEHVDHLVDLVGIDHVALSSDGYLNGWPEESKFYPGSELSSYRRWKLVIQRLSKLTRDGRPKYAVNDLRKILGENLVRLYQEILVGHTQPILEPVQFCGDRVVFSWKPSKAIAVPEPRYDLVVCGLDGGAASKVHVERDLQGVRVEVPKKRLAQFDGYSWLVVARNGKGTTTTRPRFFSLWN